MGPDQKGAGISVKLPTTVGYKTADSCGSAIQSNLDKTNSSDMYNEIVI